MPCRLMSVAASLITVGAATSGAQTRWEPAAHRTQIRLWPGGAPDTQLAPDRETAGTAPRTVAGKSWTYISDVSRPTVTVYSPAGENSGVAVLVFPGGGYNVLAIDLEGTEVCDWLTSRRITCVLLKYRVPHSGPQHHPECNCEVNPRTPAALQDAQRALGLVRLRAAEWHIDSRKVGVLGFSAGGHLVADISNHYQRRAYVAVDAADKESCRPDFAIAIYPGHLWVPSKTNPLGLNPNIRVTRGAPPTFIVQAETDTVDGVEQSLAYYNALRNAGVPTEMHLYTSGGHAFGLRRTNDPITDWPQLVEKWLETIGILRK